MSILTLVVVGFLALISGTALISSYRYFGNFFVALDMNNFSSPQFDLGLSHRHWHNDKGECMETFCLGLYLFNLEIVFFK